MNSDQRAAAVTDAIAHLDWFKIPHTIDQVIGIYAEATSELAGTTARSRSNDQMVDGIKASAAEGRGAKGGHSDPTPAAALAGHPDAVDDDVTIGSIDASIALLCGSVLEVADALAEAMGREPYRAPLGTLGRQSRISDASTDLHRLTQHLGAIDAMERGEANHWDYVIRTAIGETAEWLHVKAEAIWLASKGETRTTASQEPGARPRECTCCAGHGITGTLGAADGLCPRCSRFQSDYKCLPDQRICRAWDRGSKSIPNGWVMECKAGAKIKPGRSRAS